jgi:stage II sporulation protein AA (anti-sigma F factor antagonist)
METNVTCTLSGNELTVALGGEIDHHSAREYRRKIDERLYYYRPKRVALDLSAISFMDSSGLGLILGRFTLARELGCELRILNPCESVEKILELAGTSRLIRIEKTVQNDER